MASSRDNRRKKADRVPPVTRERRMQILGDSSPRCPCGYDKPEGLQKHHMGGWGNEAPVEFVCLNHHAELTAAQEGYRPLLTPDPDRSPLERLATFLLDLSNRVAQFAEWMRRWGEWLLEFVRGLRTRYGDGWWKGLPPSPAF